jgi:hypothetical protein
MADWQGDKQVLSELLQERHEWDASVVPFYVFWLRGDRADIPE